MKNLLPKMCRIIKDKNYRTKVLLSLKLSRLLPDRLFLKKMFKNAMGRKLDLSHPVSFNEKLQWLKLNDRNPLYTQLVDKYETKTIVESIIGRKHIIPTIGIWDSFDKINFDALPNRFVLKCTHDSGGLIICKNKSDFDIAKSKKKINKSLKQNYYFSSREWPYKHVKPRVIAEEFMEETGSDQCENPSGLVDYKFFCFNGEPRFVYVSKGLEDHRTAQISFYDLDGNEMPFHRTDYSPISGKCNFPETFEEMKQIAGTIAKWINNSFSRIDLYSINGRVYFGEITFFPTGGFLPIEPEEWDYKLGEWLELPLKNEQKK